MKEVTKFDLPGPGGKRFDYLTIDPDDHYLISAHLAADQNYVIDLRTNKVFATVIDTPGAGGKCVSELTTRADQMGRRMTVWRPAFPGHCACGT